MHLSSASSHPLLPIRVVSTHAYSLKLTPTCTRAHVHSVCFSAVELVIAAVVSATISSVHGQHVCTSRAVSTFLSSRVGDFKYNPCHLPPHSYHNVQRRYQRWFLGHETQVEVSCASKHFCVLHERRKWVLAVKQTDERLLSFSEHQLPSRRLPHAAGIN